MRICIGSRPAGVRVETTQLERLDALDVVIAGLDLEQAEQALVNSGMGTALTIESAWLSIDRLRSAGPGDDVAWAHRFNGAMDYARDHGWISAGGELVRAHCIWSGPEQ